MTHQSGSPQRRRGCRPATSCRSPRSRSRRKSRDPPPVVAHRLLRARSGRPPGSARRGAASRSDCGAAGADRAGSPRREMPSSPRGTWAPARCAKVGSRSHTATGVRTTGARRGGVRGSQGVRDPDDHRDADPALVQRALPALQRAVAVEELHRVRQVAADVVVVRALAVRAVVADHHDQGVPVETAVREPLQQQADLGVGPGDLCRVVGARPPAIRSAYGVGSGISLGACGVV